MVMPCVGQALVLLDFPVLVKALHLPPNRLLTHVREKQWKWV
jgi:hypothetical protein